ncbi:hypothetical protein MLD38_008506 [Melastoma candidum]|uniref:Uncharacterized protein n=1 Tax=Melastoma candidum TaxID=119954 RepID=A0ACB9RUI3_9MYRT|nr:hypothetical protein MLD38_008506 [Melastoma candidum]
MKILGMWLSPFVKRTMITLNLKGVKYQLIEEIVSPKSELLLKANPVYKKIKILGEDKVPGTRSGEVGGKAQTPQ